MAIVPPSRGPARLPVRGSVTAHKIPYFEGVTTMYAVIRTGGKQYRVAKDDLITVETVAGEPGAEVRLDQVLMIADGTDAKVGSPVLTGAAVMAEVVEQTRTDKVLVFKKRRRHNYRRKKGHRQHQTVLKITGIVAG